MNKYFPIYLVLSLTFHLLFLSYLKLPNWKETIKAKEQIVNLSFSAESPSSNKVKHLKAKKPTTRKKPKKKRKKVIKRRKVKKTYEKPKQKQKLKEKRNESPPKRQLKPQPHVFKETRSGSSLSDEKEKTIKETNDEKKKGINPSEKKEKIKAPSKDLKKTKDFENEKKADLETYLKLVFKEVEEHKYYPPLAKRFGMEGTVEVEFLINKEGKVTKITILKSSGSKILDRGAVKLIEKCNFPPLPKSFKESYLKVKIPIHYKLK